ncbi:MAG: serine/threonine-protein kinase PknK, partial [Myxococcales bacterium]|nr:serine/threonine-protein kinase PknK [Myxococcales bacterium]
LFAHLRETLIAFTREQPVMWLLDDLDWADDLSLDFLRSISADFLQEAALFILGTYRSEEATEAIASLAKLPHATHLALKRLDERAIASMIGDMLALREAPAFFEFVAARAEGNPFFVAEHVRTAVAERVLYRDPDHSWQLLRPSSVATPRFDDLPLPRSLREHLELRLRKLTPAAQQVGLASAVTGREVTVDLLPEVADLPADVVDGALDELLRRQIFEQLESGGVRFAHDKLREVAYALAAPERAVELHGRMARALEVRWRDRADQGTMWATIGRHLAAAREPEQAARYLARAAEQARSVHANGEAIRLYREAITQSGEARPRGAAEASADAAGALHEGLAEVLALTGRWDEARAAGEEALRHVPAADVVRRARLHRRIGKTWETEHRHDEAQRWYGLAQELLGQDVEGASRERRDEWIQLQIDRHWLHYWRAQLPEMNAILATLRPVIETSGSAPQRAQFFLGLAQAGLRRNRYVVDEETLAFARASRRAGDDPSAAAELPMVQFAYGVVLLLHGALAEAETELRAALALARRAGDAAQQARCLTYLTLTARKRQRDAEVRELAAQTLEASSSAGMRDYVAAARANQAWLALRSGDLEGAERLARVALDLWRSLSLVFPLQWTALLPLLSIAMARGDTAQAVGCAGDLLNSHQQPLPAAVSDALMKARGHFERGESEEARAELRAALDGLGPEFR